MGAHVGNAKPGAKAAWQAAANAAEKEFIAESDAATDDYNDAVEDAETKYDEAAQQAGDTMAAAYAAAATKAQGKLKDAEDEWNRAEGDAWSAYLGETADADAAWAESEERAWQDYLGASGATANYALTATGAATANLTGAMQAGTGRGTRSSENVTPVVGTTVSGGNSIITENLPDGTKRLSPQYGKKDYLSEQQKKWAREAGRNVDHAIKVTTTGQWLTGRAGENVKPNARYIDTARAGTIDLQHVTSAAYSPPLGSTVGGVVIEFYQLSCRHGGAFAREDLLSNHYGGIAGMRAGLSSRLSIGMEVENILNALEPLGPPRGK